VNDFTTTEPEEFTMRRRMLAPVALCALSLSGCFWMIKTTKQVLEESHQRAAAAMGSPREAIQFAGTVESFLVQRRLDPGTPDAVRWVGEAKKLLNAALNSRKEEAPILQAALGTLLLASGDRAGGTAALETSLEARPSLQALLPLLRVLEEQRAIDRIVVLCKRTLPVVVNPGARFTLLDSCLSRTHAASVEGGLAWASPEDVSFYRMEQARRQQAAASRNRCYTGCNAMESRCRSQCGRDGNCFAHCGNAGSSCRSGC
jgi:hypothetical protein